MLPILSDTIVTALRAYAEEKMQQEAKRLLDQWTKEIVLIRKEARESAWLHPRS